MDLEESCGKWLVRELSSSTSTGGQCAHRSPVVATVPGDNLVLPGVSRLCMILTSYFEGGFIGFGTTTCIFDVCERLGRDFDEPSGQFNGRF